MIKSLLAGAILTAAGVAATVLAQPPGENGREGRPQGPPPNPIVAALDKDGDHEISADELKEATASLLTLDKNGDGKLTDGETRPPRPEGFGPGGRGPEGQGPPRDGQGPPQDREGPPRDGEGPPRDGQGPPRDGEGPPRDGEGPPRDGGGPPRDGQGRGDMPPRPNPERFVEDAMRFDADGDEKLSRDELRKFAEEMAKRQGPPPEGRGRAEGRPGEGPPRDGGPDGPGPGRRGEGQGRAPGAEAPGGERPQRPPAE